jgi:hypothetical protein
MALPMFQAKKSKQGINCFIWRHPREKMDQNLNISRIILNFFNLDFTFSLAFKILSIKVVVLVENGICNHQSVFIHLPYLGSHPYSTTT